MLRAYLRRWKAEVGIFFEGTGPDSSDDQLRAIAPKHPAFEGAPGRLDGIYPCHPTSHVFPSRYTHALAGLSECGTLTSRRASAEEAPGGRRKRAGGGSGRAFTWAAAP